jgi:hypothetical protein
VAHHWENEKPITMLHYVPQMSSFVLVAQSHRISVTAVGHALAKAKLTLVYGGGSEGIMGLVSGAVLEGGGKVVGIIPYAMDSAGGEGRHESDIPSSLPQLSEIGRENVCTPRFFSFHTQHASVQCRQVETASFNPWSETKVMLTSFSDRCQLHARAKSRDGQASSSLHRLTRRIRNARRGECSIYAIHLIQQ